MEFYFFLLIQEKLFNLQFSIFELKNFSHPRFVVQTFAFSRFEISGFRFFAIKIIYDGKMRFLFTFWHFISKNFLGGKGFINVRSSENDQDFSTAIKTFLIIITIPQMCCGSVKCGQLCGNT
jgi:hypothetical protein